MPKSNEWLCSVWPTGGARPQPDTTHCVLLRHRSLNMEMGDCNPKESNLLFIIPDHSIAHPSCFSAG